MLDAAFRVELLDRSVCKPLPSVAASLQFLPMGWTHAATSTDDGVCFAHVRVGETPKELICDKAVYLLIDEDAGKPSSLEVTLVVQLKDMLSLQETSFRSKVMRNADIFDMLQEIASGGKVFFEKEEEIQDSVTGLPITDDVKQEQQLLLQADQIQREQEAFIALQRESQTRRIAAAQQQQLQLDAQNRYEQQLLQQLQNLSKEQREQLAFMAQPQTLSQNGDLSNMKIDLDSVPQGMDILTGLQQVLASNLLESGDSTFGDPSASLLGDTLIGQQNLLQDSKRIKLDSQLHSSATSASTSAQPSPSTFTGPTSQLQSGFNSWMQQQTLGSRNTSPSASVLSDARRETGGLVGFENQDSFTDSLDLDNGVSLGSLSSAVNRDTSQEVDRPHKCLICGRGFKTKAHHRDHMRLHSTVCEFKCPVCYREFKQKSCFTHHLSRVHKNDGPFACSICGLVFERVHDLARHIPQSHKNDPKVCGYMDDTPVKKEPMPSGIQQPSITAESSVAQTEDDSPPSIDGSQMLMSMSQSEGNSFAGFPTTNGSIQSSEDGTGQLFQNGGNSNNLEERSSLSDMKFWNPGQLTQSTMNSGETRTPEEIQRQNLLTLERLLLSPQGIAAAAALSGDVAVAAAALSSAADVSQNPPTPAEAQVLRQQAMAIFQQQQMQQLQQQMQEKQHMEQELFEHSQQGILPSMSTFVGTNGTNGVNNHSTSLSPECSNSSASDTIPKDTVNGTLPKLELKPSFSFPTNGDTNILMDDDELSQDSEVGEDNVSKEEEAEPQEGSPAATTRGMPYELECKECELTFKSSATYESHSKTIHGNDRPYKCKMCANSFKRKHHLVEHARLHSGKRGFKCNICGKEFKQRCTLTHHTRTHSMYSCPVCHKKFNGDLFLMKHMSVYNHLTPEMLADAEGTLKLPSASSLQDSPSVAPQSIGGTTEDLDSDEGRKDGISFSVATPSKDMTECISSLKAALTSSIDGVNMQELLTTAVGAANVQELLSSAFAADGTLKQPLTPSQLLTASQLMTSAQQLMSSSLFDDDLLGLGVRNNNSVQGANVTTESVPVEVSPMEVMRRCGDD